MGRFQFSLLSLLGAVIVIAIACAAIRFASQLWASTIFTMTMAILLFATMAVFVQRAEARAFYLGFTVFGWGYLLIAFGMSDWQRPGVGMPGFSDEKAPLLLTTKALHFMHSKLARPDPKYKAPSLPGGPAIGGAFGAMPPVLVPSWFDIEQIGHLLFALLIAFHGGVLARFLWCRSRRSASVPT